MKTFVIILILWVLAIVIFCAGYWLGMRITQLKNGIDIFDDDNEIIKNDIKLKIDAKYKNIFLYVGFKNL